MHSALANEVNWRPLKVPYAVYEFSLRGIGSRARVKFAWFCVGIYEKYVFEFAWILCVKSRVDLCVNFA